MVWVSKKELIILRAMAAEYEAFTKHHHAGHDYESFLSKHVLPQADPKQISVRAPICSDLNFHCTFPECGCGR